jgi:hypothetical protein
MSESMWVSGPKQLKGCEVQNRIGGGGVIRPRASRTFFDALWRARLEPPVRNAEIGELFLDLLVLGIDHELVGSDVWYQRILSEAPDRRRPSAEQEA